MRALSRLAVIVALSSLAVVAREAPAEADPLTAQEEANARFQTGLKYYDARDFESARLAFKQAYAVLDKPGILLNLALSELYSDHPLDALTHFEKYLAEGNPTPDKRERAKKGMDEAFKKTGHLAVTTSRAAELKVDDKPVTWPVPLVHVTPGAHVVTARLGDKTRTANADAKAGETANVDLTLDDPSAGAAAGGVGAAGAGGVGAAGAASPGTSSSSSGVTEPPREAPATGSFWGWRSVTGLVLMGVGAVGLGVGIASAAEESSESDRAKDLAAGLPGNACVGSSSPACADLASAVDARDSAGSRAGVLLPVGGAALGVGALLTLSAAIWPHRRDSSAARIIPITGPRQAGLLFTTNF